MNRFLNETLIDIRHGRQSWRVFAVLCAPAFVLALVASALQHVA